MTNKIRSYDALAAHLSPEDPAEGVRQIDTAILTLQRARYRRRNCARAIYWLGITVFSLCVLFLAAGLYCWINPKLSSTLIGFIARVPISVAVLLFPASLALNALSWWFDHEDVEQLPQPPDPINDWLVAHGKSDLRYWPQIYWPYVKVLAHRRDVLGFVFWRKHPRPVDEHPPVPVRFQERAALPDPHWAYMRSADGGADSEAYLVDFEKRLDAWDRLSCWFTLAVLAVLFVTVWLPIFPATPAGRLTWICVLLAFVLVIVLIVFGVGFVRLQWLPSFVMRYWFRDLPPEAKRFRDHMLAITD